MSMKNVWNSAAACGLVLGLVSTAYMFATQLLSTSHIPAFISTILNFLLWGIKFGGCIWLMKFFMNKFAKEYSEADNRTVFRMGLLTALLSAIVYAAASFFNAAYISADMFTEQYSQMMQQMAPMMDSNSMTMMKKMVENMPNITFFSNLIYCFLYGTILSAILSRNIPSKDPFADYKPDQQ
ncbi:MAG: DUF4199 domain-containing protein [Bacteroidales bacterium]|nr:DUF4199 domain-containing protein [Bacteroidales bacterium]MBQ6689678.1 DUF4199 domain-containing protein [Bacteroidales bacterium]